MKDLGEMLARGGATLNVAKSHLPEEVATAAAGKKKPAAAGLLIPFADPEVPVTIEFPFVYPSLNKLLTMAKTGIGVESAAKRRFKEDVQNILMAGRHKAFRSRVEISIQLYVFNSRDYDNDAPKWLLDSLKGWLFVDDRRKYVKGVEIPDPIRPAAGEGEHMAVTITPVREGGEED